MQYHSTHSIPQAIRAIIKLNSVREREKERDQMIIEDYLCLD